MYQIRPGIRNMSNTTSTAADECWELNVLEGRPPNAHKKLRISN